MGLPQILQKLSTPEPQSSDLLAVHRVRVDRVFILIDMIAKAPTRFSDHIGAWAERPPAIRNGPTTGHRPDRQKPVGEGIDYASRSRCSTGMKMPANRVQVQRLRRRPSLQQPELAIVAEE